jgi:hypothetical protein
MVMQTRPGELACVDENAANCITLADEDQQLRVRNEAH